MFCSGCGTALQDGVIFCFNCGGQIAKDIPMAGMPQRLSNKSIAVMAVLCFSLTSIFGFLLVVWVNKNDPGFPTPAKGLFPHPTPPWAANDYNVGPASLELAPNEVQALPLNLNEGWRNIQLMGKFEARGITESEIEMAVTDEAGVADCKSRRAYRAWFRSGKMAAGTINTVLPSQKLFLMVINPSSNRKSVALNIQLQYEHLIK